MVRRLEGEYARLLARRADQIIVAERCAIIAVTARVHVAGGEARARVDRAIRTNRRRYAVQTHEP